jgi:ribonuclease BN (tRNA processing enzyme)
MRLTVVGSGDAFHGGGRRHSCYLLEGDGVGPVMIDFGATALYGLRQLGRSARDIAGFAFTHLHGDHVGGYPFMIIDGMFQDVRTSLLDVVGPVGVEARLARVLDAAYGDLSSRARPFGTRMREIAPGGELELAGATIRGFAAQHMDPPEQPLCLRVSAAGKTVAFSGDTAPCDGLFEAADGADLLVAECSCMAQPCGRHCTWEDWKVQLSKVRSKRVLLTHLGTEVRAKSAELLAEVPAGVDVAFADDGMVLEV